MLALGLLVAAIALACTWTMWERPSSQTSLSAETPTPAPSETPAAEETPLPEGSAAPEATVSPEASAAPEDAQQSADAGTVNTVVYYQGQLRLSGAGAVQGARRGRHRQGHAFADGQVHRQRHAGGAAGAAHSAAGKPVHGSGHCRRPGPHRPGQGSAGDARRGGGEQHDHRHRAGADGVSHRGEGGIPRRRATAGGAAARHERFRAVHPRGSEPRNGLGGPSPWRTPSR